MHIIKGYTLWRAFHTIGVLFPFLWIFSLDGNLNFINLFLHSEKSLFVLISQLISTIVLLFYFFLIFFEREKERERESLCTHTSGGGAERGRHRIWSRPGPVSTETNVGLESMNCEIMAWAEIQSWLLNQLSHPGTPQWF